MSCKKCKKIITNVESHYNICCCEPPEIQNQCNQCNPQIQYPCHEIKKRYKENRLVSNQQNFASFQDLNAVNTWGIIETIYHNRPIFLIGNFGDGTISGYNTDGTFLGKLRDNNCVDIILDGLWGLTVGQNNCTIFFASGPNDENNGLVGSLIEYKRYNFN